MKDELYQNIRSESGSFRFDQSVVDVFDDMIRRSVPGYGLTLEMIGVIAKRAFGQQDGVAYDLGCSLGASMFPVLKNSAAQVIGVDLSAEMLKQAEVRLGPIFSGRYSLKQANLENFKFDTKARLIVSNFTLQFLPLEQRLSLLERIYEALDPGGIFLMSEKLLTESESENALLVDLHHTFKSTQGYSEMEISRKRDAIENVLIPETKETHLTRLQNIGFSNPTCWYQCFNFSSFLAMKT